MFRYRMAREPSLVISLLLLILSYITAACALNLDKEISSLIPRCAQRCFESFLFVSFDVDECGSTPSLSCLCASYGKLGFTLGEGAVQCITAEKNIGSCNRPEATEEVINHAYRMCNGKPNAVLPTHGIITATLILPPSGSGAITFPPIVSTRAKPATSTPASISTTKSAETSNVASTTLATQSKGSSTTTQSTSTAGNASTQPSASSTQAETPASSSGNGKDGKKDDDDNDDSGGPLLSTGQIVGISVGAVAAVAVAIVAIFLARYYRRRNHPQAKTGFFLMRDTWGYKPDRKGVNSTNSWIAHQISAPLEPSPAPPAPPAQSYNRKSWRPEAIGLAISPGQSRNATQTPPPPPRRTSKLLLAKPILLVKPLNVSKKPSPPSYQQSTTTYAQMNPYYTAAISSTSLSQSSQGQQSPRRGELSRSPKPQSIPPSRTPRLGSPEMVTAAALASPIRAPSPRSKPQPPAPLRLQIPQRGLMAAPQFHHRRESSATEFEEDGRASLSPTGQVWRPPPTDPQSAATYYVADRYGNWVLGTSSSASQPAELEGFTPITSLPKMSPREVSPQSPSANGKAPELPSMAGSLRARPSLAPPAAIIPAQDVPRSSSVYSPQSAAQRSLPFPPLPTQSNQPRNSQSRRSKGRSLTRTRAMSEDSGVTTFTTSSEASSSGPSPLIDQQYSLSPVVESPGRSPVSYPKIPGRDRNRASDDGNKYLRVDPPPSRTMQYYPPGQPSPTLGMMQPQQQQQQQQRQLVSAPQQGLSSYKVPTKGRKPFQDLSLLRTGSPSMRIVEPSPEPEDDNTTSNNSNAVVNDKDHLPSATKTHPPAFFFHPPYPQPLSTSTNASAMNTNNTQPRNVNTPLSVFSSKNHDRFHQPQPQNQQLNQHQQPKPTDAPKSPSEISTASIIRPYNPPPPLHPPDITYTSPTSDRRSSTNSSLLAKRIGSDRAANMVIPTAKQRPGQPNWHHEELLFPDQEGRGAMRSGDLPATPTWVPRLTPTRRGDDLFLNVQ